MHKQNGLLYFTPSRWMSDAVKMLGFLLHKECNYLPVNSKRQGLHVKKSANSFNITKN